METNYLSLIIGLLGSWAFISSCFSIKRRRILLLGALSSALLIGSYLVKGDMTAGTMVVVSLVRNILFIVEQKSATSWLTRRRIFVAVAIFIIVSWSLTAGLNAFNWHKLLIVASPLLLLYGLSLDNIVHLKIFTILNGFGWLAYEAITGSYTIMLGESVGILMAFIAIVRIMQTNTPTETILTNNRSSTIEKKND